MPTALCNLSRTLGRFHDHSIKIALKIFSDRHFKRYFLTQIEIHITKTKSLRFKDFNDYLVHFLAFDTRFLGPVQTQGNPLVLGKLI